MYQWDFGGRFSRQGHKINSQTSLLEPLTGNLNSLMSRKDSLFFLGVGGSSMLAKHRELCSMQAGDARRPGQNLRISL